MSYIKTDSKWHDMWQIEFFLAPARMCNFLAKFEKHGKAWVWGEATISWKKISRINFCQQQGGKNNGKTSFFSLRENVWLYITSDLSFMVFCTLWAGKECTQWCAMARVT